MKEPSPRSSRLVLAGAFVVVIVAGGAGFLLGRGAKERPPPPTILMPPPKLDSETAAPRGALQRADLIAIAALAADDAATGRAAREEVVQADGRRFELRLPFGCEGPAGTDGNAPMRWRYDRKAKALRIHVETVNWPMSQWWPQNAPAGIKAIEGFRIQRPWTSREDCPTGGERRARAGDEAAATDEGIADDRVLAAGDDAAGNETDGRGAKPAISPDHSLAIGQIVPADAPRDEKGRSFDTVVRIAEDALDLSKGLRLKIGGRIASLPEAGPILCRQPAGPEQRPLCLIGIVMDEVAIENPATGETLAIWNVPLHNGPER